MTLRTGEPKLRRLIDAFAGFYGLPHFWADGQVYTPGELLEALMWHESWHGDPKARRYEPQQDRAGRTDAPTDPDRPGIDDGDLEDDASYGYTQVMGYNWRKLIGAPVGTKLDFSKAFEPGFNITAGVLMLLGEISALKREQPDMPEAELTARALARYNGGPTGDDPVDADGGPDPRGKMRLAGYVAKIADAAARVRADRLSVSWGVA